MSAMASKITSLTIVYSIVYSGADKREHQRSASLAFVWKIHRWPVNSPHKGPVTRIFFPFDDVIMEYRFSCIVVGLMACQMHANAIFVLFAIKATWSIAGWICCVFGNFLVREWARESHQNSAYQTTLPGQNVGKSMTHPKQPWNYGYSPLMPSMWQWYILLPRLCGYVIVRHVGNIEFYSHQKFH